MKFVLTERQKQFRKEIKEFTRNYIAPLAIEIDETGRFPQETIKKMAQSHLMGIPFPSEYGGSGKSYLDFVLAVEEISKACASTGVTLSTHTALCSWPIYAFGNNTQRESYLKPLTKGENLGAFCLTEPNAGTDAGSIKTTAVLKEDYWILNGKKYFVTNGGEADIYVVFASTHPKLRGKGISSFIIEKGFDGFKLGKIEKKMGIRGSMTREIIFNNCKVPKSNLLGEENKGLSIAFSALNVGRIGIAAQALGIAEGAFDKTVKYLKERKQFEKHLSDFQGLQFEIADMYTKIEAVKMLVYKAAWTLDQGLNISSEAAVAKLIASEAAMSITTKAVQLHGGYGYLQEHEVERMMRDAKITEIYEGTSQVQKMIIASHVFK